MAATPESVEALNEYLGRFNGGEFIAAQTCALMAWNLACKLIDEAIEEENKGDK